MKMELRDANDLIVQELLKEFKTGYGLGQDAMDLGENYHHLIMMTDDDIEYACAELLDLAQRMNQYAKSLNGLAVNQRKLAVELSSILATLFHNAGKKRGAKDAG